MKTKKLIALLLASLMVFGIIFLAGCGGGGGSSEPAFEPQGETVSSLAGTLSVLAPSVDYDMWKDIDWDIEPKENRVEMGYYRSGDSVFYVDPATTKLSGKFDTLEKLETALEDGSYAEWLGDSEVVKVEVGEFVLYDKVKLENDPNPHEFIFIKDGKVFFIDAYCKDEDYLETYDNLLLQVLMTVETNMEQY